MHPSRLRLGPSQSRPLTDASPGSARSPGLRVCRAAPSHRRNIHTHAPFRTECQSFLRCRDTRLTISRKQRSGHQSGCGCQQGPGTACRGPRPRELRHRRLERARPILLCSCRPGEPPARHNSASAWISSWPRSGSSGCRNRRALGVRARYMWRGRRYQRGHLFIGWQLHDCGQGSQTAAEQKGGPARGRPAPFLHISSAILKTSQPRAAKPMTQKSMTEATAFPQLMKHPRPLRS
jgi:hypothetical protein